MFCEMVLRLYIMSIALLTLKNLVLRVMKSNHTVPGKPSRGSLPAPGVHSFQQPLTALSE